MQRALGHWGGRPLGRGRAMSAVAINQFATPGLGSLMGGRYLAGAGQLLLALAGCGFLLAWFVRMMKAYYGLISTANAASSAVTPPAWLWKIGALLFVVSWLWALVTSFSLLREAKANALRALASAAASPPVITDFSPPK